MSVTDDIERLMHRCQGLRVRIEVEAAADMAPVHDATRVQVSRPGDRAMLATPAGAELVRRVAAQLAETPCEQASGTTGVETELYTRAQLDAAVAAERERIINALPGGYSVDPQWIADMIRGLA